MNKLINYSEYLIKWLRDTYIKINAKTFIIGISGGIDSALLLKILSLTKKQIIACFIDIGNSQLDKKCVKILKNKFSNIKFIEMNLVKNHNDLVRMCKIKSKIAINNLKTRLRALVLYSLANQYCGIVVGSLNYCEFILGYFTKYGDNACDIAPFINLTKSQIYQLAKYYKIPKIIIDRLPSNGYDKNITDEKEFGFKYIDLENFLSKKRIDKKVQTLITRRIKNNNHKQNGFLIPKKINRF